MSAHGVCHSPPRVVCLRRTKSGEILQNCDVYIGRACCLAGWNLPKSPFANPYTIGQCGSAEAAVGMYEQYIRRRPDLLALIPGLGGKVLGCWCKRRGPEICHGDVLVKLWYESRK